MRRSIELGIMLVSVLLALSIFVALAENQTASKDKLNATKTMNISTNVTAKNITSTNLTAKNASMNTTNPFANAKGQIPGETGGGKDNDNSDE